MAEKNTKKFVLIDGNALIHRAFHALPPLTTPKGELINAVYGFATTLFKVLSEVKPDYIACTFDHPSPTFRHKEYEEYKAHRKKAPTELYEQIPRTKKLLKTINIPIFERKGYEADDVIASLVSQIEKKNIGTIIVTGDMDELQLVSKKTKVYTMRRGFSDTVIYNLEKVKEKYGLLPNQLKDYKALRGDPSDNIPGVAGIGEKGALSLIQKYKNIENLYKNLNELSEKTASLLKKFKREAIISKRLATLVYDLPLKIELKKSEVHAYNKEKAIKLFRELGFKSLIKRIFNQDEDKIQKEINYKIQPNLFDDLEKNINEIDSASIDQALEPILKKMQKRGVLIDIKLIKKLSKKTGNEIKKLEKTIYKSAGHKFNINSPKQLAEILFEELQLPVLKRTKTGYSTDASVLEELSDKHKIIEYILSYREFFKLKSTYLDALPLLADKHNRIHTTYAQDTSTGRLSSKNPNLQNIPARDGLGQKVRQAFIAKEGYKLLAADYSQIELRIIASLSGDTNMIKAFKDGQDIHAKTASEIFNTDIKNVDKNMRRIAKTVNFGIIYGMGPHGLARTLKIGYEAAEGYIDNYFAYHSGILTYIEKIKHQAREKGYVETLFNRKRYLPEIQSGYSRFKKAAERMAINMPVQGTAADLLKLAMIRIDKDLLNLSKKSAMLLQVHDELIFEVMEKDAEKISELVKDRMENVYKLEVPIKVDISVGNNWGELK